MEEWEGISYQDTRDKDFWCEQAADYHPKCECKKQCWDCAIIQGDDEKPESLKTIN